MSRPLRILGINAHHADAAAALLINGEWIAASEEERHRRVKHFAGFPTQAVRFCLDHAGITIDQIDHIAVNRDPSAARTEKILDLFRYPYRLRSIPSRLLNRRQVGAIKDDLADACGVSADSIRVPLHNVEHHRAHLASAFFPSPFEQAAVVSVDGFGDYTSTLWGSGNGNKIAVADPIQFPHSLGHFYLAITQFLGFASYGDEYKVMGMAAHGEPRFVDEMRQLVQLRDRGRFELGLRFFRHHQESLPMRLVDGQPRFDDHFSPAITSLFGPVRAPHEELEQRHKDIAASAQVMYEEALFHLLDYVHQQTQVDDLCIAGGCGMNSLANGRIAERTRFRRVWVQPAAGDAGGAVGAAAWTWNCILGETTRPRMTRADLGPSFDDAAIDAVLHEAIPSDFHQAHVEDDEELYRTVADKIASGGVIGWFQGGCEWGPRALGHRSILADPRRSDMRDLLNLKIKRRESFRPFAPSILSDAVDEWFERVDEVPFMTHVLPIREEQRGRIPAVTHNDGTGRLQTVTEESNPRYYRLIRAFAAITGVPMLLNTSFNENEPIVCHPKEAIDCFLRTKMDMLVLGNRIIERVPNSQPIDGGVSAQMRRELGVTVGSPSRRHSRT